jgi:hypothetical protein
MPYCVYVIELDKAFSETKKAKEANPNARLDKPCIYVGHSSKPPLVRCLEHKNGIRNKKGYPLYSKIAHRYYVRPRPRLYEKYNPIETKEEAMAKERELTAKYRKRGYTVWSN